MKTGSYGDISLRTIEIFITAAEHSSFSKAATTLFLSQSVISRSVQSLEDTLGFPLFARTNQGVKLTPEGESIYISFKHFLTNIKNTITEVKASSHSFLGTVIRIGCLKAEGTSIALDNLISEYKKLRPDVRFDITYADYNNLRQGLVCKDLDCIVSYSLGFGKLWKVKTKCIERMDSFFAISAKHPMAKLGSFKASRLNGQPLFLLSLAEMEAAERRALAICAEYGIEPRIEYMPNRADVEIAVKNNRGFTIDGLDFSRRYPNDIKLFKIEKPIVNQNVIICWHTDHCPQPCLDFLGWAPEAK